ncbi:MAG TPA: Crp/Fnr family transcriptional regulator [Terracidiphilus sp.]|nr:Crp/Fnr family transcriptional regulator [Terracidiphilus sp.]
MQSLGMPKDSARPFSTKKYLATAGPGKTIFRVKAKQIFSSQGDRAECLFYLRLGRARLTVVSKGGKEATVTLLAAGDFFGEECLAGPNELRTTSATAITVCVVLKITPDELIRVLHEESSFADRFVQFLALRSTRTQADLVDQLFNNSERRLARILLIMADYGNQSGPEALIPQVTQETLANMIGTTRSRVSFFMNRFRKLGYVSYRNRIRVHKSLLMMVLQDRLPEQNATRPTLLEAAPGRARNRRGTKELEVPEGARKLAG